MTTPATAPGGALCLIDGIWSQPIDKAGLPDLPRAHRGITGADLRTACVELHRQRQAAIRPAVRFSPMPAVAKIIGDYSEFLDAIRARVDEMCMTRLELDHQAGLQDGYSGKTLGRQDQIVRHAHAWTDARRTRPENGAHRGHGADWENPRPAPAAGTAGAPKPCAVSAADIAGD